ncbi:MAG TPA: histidine kinase dimerization/phospho-acceptor domain-containing protein, partial [Gemmatimonadaceae bacterium]|nr:histidine kinase dimerization/phospho-acceptor domain-containing protein [Gemmatimonadaceae bacterium]
MDSGSFAPTRAFGLRIALWYATLFIVGALAIVFLTYYLTSASLAQRDRQLINAKLGQYAAAYARGGLDELADTVRSEQSTAPERLFVRVVDRGTEALVLSSPNGWDPQNLETGSIRLLDGTLVQVGKSTEQRDDLLARFRAALGIVTLTIVVVALTGGFLVTRTAVLPIRRLTQTVASIIRTGRTDARVPVAGNAGEGQQESPGSTDAIDELTMLFNAMLDKIEGLVTGMRGALDNVSHDLRTPLTHLRGAAEMALAGPPDPERYREALADCVEEADRVLVMLNTLMDISEAESGAMQLKREPIRLADIVARAVELYRDVAEAKGVSIDVRLKPDATTGEEI